MFDRNFPSPQVKLSVIISNSHGIHELPHKLLSDLGNSKISGKSS